MKYNLSHRTLGTGVIEAARFETDGAGTRFYNEEGAVIASFHDGDISSVVPESVVFTAPAAASE